VSCKSRSMGFVIQMGHAKARAALVPGVLEPSDNTRGRKPAKPAGRVSRARGHLGATTAIAGLQDTA
jgi:hypothetical protein